MGFVNLYLGDTGSNRLGAQDTFKLANCSVWLGSVGNVTPLG